MRLFLTIPFFLSSLGLQAQEFAFEMWHDGKVVLENGDTLTGNVKYDMQTDLVQVQVGDLLETYSARKLLFLEIFDKTVKRYRRMYSLPYNTSGNYKAPVIFELLEEGKTIPFIARYRKEKTGELNEIQLREISDALEYAKKLKEGVLVTLFPDGGYRYLSGGIWW